MEGWRGIDGTKCATRGLKRAIGCGREAWGVYKMDKLELYRKYVSNNEKGRIKYLRNLRNETWGSADFWGWEEGGGVMEIG